jgi:hypothetical protein
VAGLVFGLKGLMAMVLPGFWQLRLFFSSSSERLGDADGW